MADGHVGPGGCYLLGSSTNGVKDVVVWNCHGETNVSILAPE